MTLEFSLQIEGASWDDMTPDLDTMKRAFNRGALRAAQYIQGTWISAAHAMQISDRGGYINGIQAEGRLEVEQVAMSGSVWSVVFSVTNTAKHASIVEDGHPAFHLPSVVNWGKATGRIKKSADGVRYMHVPFRHYAFKEPGARRDGGQTRTALRNMMPRDIYLTAKRQLSHHKRLGVGPVYRTMPSGKRQYVQADRYVRPKTPHRRALDRSHVRTGIALGGGQGAHNMSVDERRTARLVGKNKHGPMVNPAWSASKFHGMFKTGTRRHTTYMTIRTMTENSQGWNIPARQGKYVARRVMQATMRNGRLEAHIMAGVNAVIGGG